MKTLTAIAVITVLIALYVTWLRPRLRQSTRPWIVWFFEVIEPIEIALWRKSETILFARFKMLTGLLLTVLTQLGTIDLTPLMPFVPDEYEGMLKLAFNMLPMTLTLLGVIDEQLRKDTTKPLELVAVAEKDMTPAVIEAVAVAEVAKAEAVATVQAEQAAKA